MSRCIYIRVNLALDCAVQDSMVCVEGCGTGYKKLTVTHIRWFAIDVEQSDVNLYYNNTASMGVTECWQLDRCTLFNKFQSWVYLILLVQSDPGMPALVIELSIIHVLDCRIKSPFHYFQWHVQWCTLRVVWWSSRKFVCLEYQVDKGKSGAESPAVIQVT